jgi:hypothetical protein
MLKNNIYNIDKEFDYSTVKSIVLKSLQKIAKEEALENTSNVLSDFKANVDLNQIDGNKASTLPPPTKDQK